MADPALPETTVHEPEPAPLPTTLPAEIDQRLRCLASRLPDARLRYPADPDFWAWFRGELEPIEALPATPGERAAFQLRVTLMIAEHPSGESSPRAA